MINWEIFKYEDLSKLELDVDSFPELSHIADIDFLREAIEEKKKYMNLYSFFKGSDLIFILGVYAVEQKRKHIFLLPNKIFFKKYLVSVKKSLNNFCFSFLRDVMGCEVLETVSGGHGVYERWLSFLKFTPKGDLWERGL